MFESKQKVVTVGRTDSNSIRLVESGVSKVQCKFEFRETGWWVLDGDGKKKSTNGTWVYANSPLPLRDKDQFRAGKTVFELQILS